jgi:hypothetical protein
VEASFSGLFPSYFGFSSSPLPYLQVQILPFYVLALVLPALGGDISGHALITKRLTKKVLSPVAYDLRGVAVSPAPAGTLPVNEFDQMVVILEGGSPSPRAPGILTINQRNTHFEPDFGWLNRRQLLKASYEWLNIEHQTGTRFNVLGVQLVTTFRALDWPFR